MNKEDLTPQDKREVGIFKDWLVEDPKVRSLAQSFAILSDEDRQRVLEWVDYLDGDASALSVEPMGPIRVEGLLIKAGVPTANGNVYSREILERAVAEMQDKIEARQVLGSFGVNQTARLSMSKASHLVTGLKMVGDRMEAEVEILDTPMGKRLKDELEKGRATLHPVFFGSVSEDGVIGEDARIAQLGICPVSETGLDPEDVE